MYLKRCTRYVLLWLAVLASSLAELLDVDLGGCEIDSGCRDDGLQLLQKRSSIQKVGAKLGNLMQPSKVPDPAPSKQIPKAIHGSGYANQLGVKFDNGEGQRKAPTTERAQTAKNANAGGLTSHKVSNKPNRQINTDMPKNHETNAMVQLKQSGSHQLNIHDSQPMYGDSTYIYTHHQTFFDRIGDAMVDWVIGIILLIFSVPVLWYNEKRNAAYESLIKRGEADVRSVSADKALPDNRNTLVHIPGGQMRAVKPVEDKHFSVKYQSGCLQLTTTVSVYQWVEKEKQEEKEKFGGGKETITTYYYEKQWSTSFNDSSSFRHPEYRNHKPQGVPEGVHKVQCDRVEFGGGFLIESTLLDMACSVDHPANIPGPVQLKSNTALSFKLADGACYVTGNQGNPQIGDVKVEFRTTTDGPATVIALQVEKKDEPINGRDTFLPYRNVRRPCCPCYDLEEEEEKLALRDAGEKTPSALAQEQSYGGCLGLLCCCCTLVNMCCASFLTPELYHLMHGKLDVRATFDDIKNRAVMLKWCLRLCGWLLMFVGLGMLFSPLWTFINVIPFFGPILSSLGGAATWFASFIVTILLAVIIVALAYSVYHPLLGLMYFILLAAIVVVILLCSVGAHHHIAAHPAH